MPWMPDGKSRFTIFDLAIVLFGRNRKIAPFREDMRRPPVHLDDLALGTAVDVDLVARAKRTAEIEDEAGENVVQRALQRKSEDDGNGSRGREQALDRQIKHIGYDREYGREIDQRSQKVANQLAFARTAFDDDEPVDQCNQEPGRPEPPGNLQDAVDRIAKRHARGLQRLVGNDPSVQQQRGEQREEDDACDGAPSRMLSEQQSTDESSDDDDEEASGERIARYGYDGGSPIAHLSLVQLGMARR
jgi:hypothetical protein